MELFTNDNGTNSTTSRALAQTASLTAYSDSLARALIVDAKKDEANADLIKASFTTAAAQDTLIELFCGVLSTDTIVDADEDTLKKLLASQQSKRSRSKGKDMTLSNYISMMSAAIAETVIRTVMGKPRGASATAGSSATTPLSDGDLSVYADDLDLANRRIRSLQSWKSTHKHLEGTIEWDCVVENIQKLQDLRPSTTTVKVIKEDPRIQAVREQMKDVDISKLNKSEKDALLQDILSKLA